MDEETGNYYYGARYYDPKWSVWLSVDPLFERYPNVSSYAYVLNNPVNAIDPNGLTDYKVNKKTGDVTQVGKANDQPDRILKTDSDGNIKRKGEGFLGFFVSKENRGKAKVATGGIKKGILNNGRNLKTQSTMLEVNLNSELQDENFENSILKVSNYLDVELGGYYLTNNKDGKDYAYLSYFEGNTDQSAGTGINFRGSNMPNTRLDQVDLKVRWHTHLSRFGDLHRLRPSSLGGNGGDLGSKKRGLEQYPNLKFLIITNPKSFKY